MKYELPYLKFSSKKYPLFTKNLIMNCNRILHEKIPKFITLTCQLVEQEKKPPKMAAGSSTLAPVS
jgi:hypothetical protein